MDRGRVRRVSVLDSNQVSIWDLGIADSFICENCVWMKAHGYCYPKEKLGRQKYYEEKNERYCSDYCTAFASAKEKMIRKGWRI